MKIPKNKHLSFSNTDTENIKLFITGDLCPVASVESDLLHGKGEYIYGDCLSALHDKDLSITNLELALTCGGTEIDKCGPNLRANPDIMQELKAGSFDIYSVANNHTRDWGDEAFMETLSHIENAGAMYVGGGSNVAVAAEPLKVVVKDVPIAVVSISMHCECDAGIETPGINAINLPYNILQIVNAAKAGYKVIVIFHDGKECIPFPSARIRNYCHAFVDAGATAVIGHHPHVVRGMEIYNGAVVAYSLGNFIFPQRKGAEMPEPFWFQGMSLRLSVNKEGLVGVDVIPHKFNHESGQLNFMNEKEEGIFLATLNKLNSILETKNNNERYFSADSESYIHSYGVRLESFANTMQNDTWITSKERQNAKVFNHLIKCNEHWDVLEALSYRKWHGVTDFPDDLPEIRKNLGFRV